MFRRILARAAGWFGFVARPDYWWFPESSSAELSRRIVAAGPGHRLEVRLAADGKMTFRVVGGANARATALPALDINESFPCPPICPGGGGG